MPRTAKEVWVETWRQQILRHVDASQAGIGHLERSLNFAYDAVYEEGCLAGFTKAADHYETHVQREAAMAALAGSAAAVTALDSCMAPKDAVNAAIAIGVAYAAERGRAVGEDL